MWAETVSMFQTFYLSFSWYEYGFHSLEYIRGYDIDGNEKLWIITSGNVNSLALVDFNNDGKNEVNTDNK